MPINASYEFLEAEKEYLAAKTLEEKIEKLEILISKAPGHKGAENLRAELRLRLKKIREKLEKGRSVGKGSRKGIRKEGYQVVLVGKTNSGRSSLLAALTNAKPMVSPNPYTTMQPEIGTMDYDGVKAQIVDLPALGSVAFDSGLVNTADCALLVVDKFEDLESVRDSLKRSRAKGIIVFSKMDILSSEEKRKLDAKCKSKRLSYVLVSSLTGEGIGELKKRIFETMGSVRIYMKEPGKSASKIPMVLVEGSTVKDVAEHILKGFSAKVKETKVTGPSAKFINQKVGLSHVLKDRDIVEFKT